MYQEQRRSLAPDPSTYVDLGLSVKWATCNLGAKNPWECGEYYAWGETEPKESYGWENYKFGENEDFLSKYTAMDHKAILDKEDDVAAIKLGSPWRIPTEAEFMELIEKCTWKWTKWGNKEGYKVVGPNGNFIFCQTLDGVGLMMIVLNITDANAVLVIMELMNLAGTRQKLKCWGFSRGKGLSSCWRLCLPLYWPPDPSGVQVAVCVDG